MKILKGNVTTPRGFTGGAICCSIKPTNTRRTDLGIIYSEVPCTAAGIFTTNKVQAAPVKLTRKHLANGRAQAVAANSYVANTCTPDGDETALAMAEAAADALGLETADIIVASTGVIGRSLPVDAVKDGIATLAPQLHVDGGDAVAKAIMTTDTVDKQAAIQCTLGGKTCTIGVVAKGSGMIDIQMGTMLAFTTTDAAISASMLDAALRTAAETTFNMVCVDGDMSTNDTLTIMANGLAGNTEIREKNADWQTFVDALTVLYTEMAKALAADGEGATKLVMATVSGAVSEKDARIAAKSIIRSDLVKTALFGSDANWGRILCAIGYSGAAMDPETVEVSFSSEAGDITVCQAGRAVPVDEDRATAILDTKAVTIRVCLGEGPGKATAYGCDLSYDYVKINGDYRS
ncbi:MAG: bifunctional glutamate N-acetyltransferase/amino-acid acetyltransferase ArgJ [Eubacteriales bacterium]|nr:bifunctional glutamate N-acetyltransferase/amino-acid acetyltransferase ArgJ [Eubacteriales bacterium]